MAAKRKSKSTARKAKAKPRSKSKAKSKSRAKAKPRSKSKSKSRSKKAFGGYAISFAGRKETVEQVFGSKPVAPSEMTKKIWAFVKSRKLANR